MTVVLVIVFLAQASDFSLAAGGGLIVALVGAYATMRTLGPNRRKIVEEVQDARVKRATDSLSTVLDRYESDNARLRTDMDELEQKVDDLIVRLEAVTEERDDLRRQRDELQRHVERMLRRFTEFGEAPPT